MLKQSQIDLSGEILWKGRFFDPRALLAGIYVTAILLLLLLLYVGSLLDPDSVYTMGRRRVLMPQWAGKTIVAISAMWFAFFMFAPILAFWRRYQLTQHYWIIRQGRTRYVWPLSEVTEARLRPLPLGCSELVFIARNESGITNWKSTVAGYFDISSLQRAMVIAGIRFTVTPRAGHKKSGYLVTDLGETIKWSGRRNVAMTDFVVFAIFLLFLVLIWQCLSWFISFLPRESGGYPDGNVGSNVHLDRLQFWSFKAVFAGFIFLTFLLPILMAGRFTLTPMKKRLDKFFGRIIITDRRVIISDMFRRRVVHQIQFAEMVEVDHGLFDNGAGFIAIKVSREHFAEIVPDSDELTSDETSKELSVIYLDDIGDSEGAYQAILQGKGG